MGGPRFIKISFSSKREKYKSKKLAIKNKKSNFWSIQILKNDNWRVCMDLLVHFNSTPRHAWKIAWVCNLQGWVGDDLDEDAPGFVVDHGVDLAGVAGVNEAAFNSHFGKEVLKKGHRSPIQVSSHNDVISRFCRV